jgi:porin
VHLIQFHLIFIFTKNLKKFFVFFSKRFIPNRWVWIGSLLYFQLLNAQDPSQGFEFSGGYTFDFAANVKGGVDQGGVFLGNVDLNFDFNTEALNLWNRGHFFMYVLNNHGNSLSALMGDFQVANNIEAEAHTRLYEIWYEHRFDFWSVLVGQHDLNSVFAVSEIGTFFINSSFGIQPDLSANFPASIFPLATLGTVISWKLTKNTTLKHAIYDGDPGSESDNPNSLKWRISKNEGALLINEIQHVVKNDSLQKSVYKLGFWKHTQDQLLDTKLFSNSHGIYFISDHVLQERNTHKVSAFTQVGFGLNKHTPVKSYFGGGLLYQGVSSKRTNDGIGLALGHTVFSNAYTSNFKGKIQNETAFELSYQWVTAGRWVFQPNVQYILNPGSDTDIPNSLMGLVRFNFSW